MAGFVLPGAAPIAESQSPINGFIATCVQASEAVMTGIYRILPTTPATTTRLANDQIARGEADYRGASYVGSAGKQLTRLGIPNTDIEGQANIAGRNWTQLINQALLQGKPVLAGFTNARALTDSQTGAQPDLGVSGHGVTIVGIDQAGSGYLVADPNTAGTSFMDYSPQTLQAAGLSSLIIPNQAPAAVYSAPSPTSAAVSAPSAAASQIAGDPALAASSAVGTAIGYGASQGIIGALQGVSPSALGTALADATGVHPVDLGIRAVLIFAAFILLLVGLMAFFFGGSGRGVAAEGAKTGAKAVVTKMVA